MPRLALLCHSAEWRGVHQSHGTEMHNYHELLFGVAVGMICGWAVVWFV